MTSTLRSLKIARTVTGSVAEMRAPKWRLSMKVMFCRWGTTLKYNVHYCFSSQSQAKIYLVTPYMKPPTVKVLMTVPMKAKVKIEPMLRKKYFFFMA